MSDRNPPRPRSRDLVGPDQEDVSSLTERQIVVRALDVVLWLKAGMKLEINALAARVTALEEAQERKDEMRDREASVHDFDPALKRLRAALKERSSNPADPLNEGTSAQIVERLAIAIQHRREQAIGLALWRAIKSWPGRFADKVGEHAITAIAVAAVAYVWHYLTTRK